MRHIILDALAVENSKTGIGQYTEELLKELFPLAAGEFSFSVLINKKLQEAHPLIDLIKSTDNCEFIKMDIPSIGIRRDLLFLLNRRKLKCDLFHCLYSNHPFFISGKQIATIHDLKYILYPEYMGRMGKLKSFYLKNVMKNAVKKCGKIIAVSNSTKNDLLRIFPDEKADAKINVIYEAASLEMSVNKELFDKYKLSEKYFLYLGELRPHKNINRLVDAFIKFTEENKLKNLRLLIAGKFHKSFSFDSDALPENIVYTGYAADENKYTLYSNTVAFCLPSLYEGFGLPILEAMKAGVPVITSNFSSTAEIGNSAAVLVDPENTDDIVEAMKKIYFDEKYRNEMVEKGKIRETEFSWKKTAAETLNIYREFFK